MAKHNMRLKIAYLLFGLSSLVKGMGKMIITKEKTILVDVLSIPGFFIVDDYILRLKTIDSSILKDGIEHQAWAMPKQWRVNLARLKRE